MRRTRLLTALALLALVAGGAGAALARTNATATYSGSAPDRPCAVSDAPSAAQAEWRLACARNVTELRRLAIESFNENKTLAIIQHEDNLSHVRATFEDGKLQAYQDCLARAAPFGRNTSGPHGGALASCMKDKLQPLRQAALASHQAERQALVDAIKAARDGAKAQFQMQEQAWLAANPRP